MENGGQFVDVFRAKHPDRREAYTCWPTSTGAEEFNFGTRIDHILISGSCLHKESGQEGHNFISCHVKDSEILIQFKRWKPGNTPRWKGGRSIKLEGSDHVPVCMSLEEIPSVPQHSTPPLSTRYCPQVYGCQQTLVSMLTRKQSAEKVMNSEESSSFLEARDCSEGSAGQPSCSPTLCLDSNLAKAGPHVETRKKARQSHWSQLSLRSFFQKSSSHSETFQRTANDIKLSQTGVSASFCHSNSSPVHVEVTCDPKDCIEDVSVSSPADNGFDDCQLSAKEKSNVALLEWQRIQQLMRNSIPLCKGHNEPCVARVVKKAGPNLGRRFYVCVRAEGPASNPEANCGYFKWAASNSKHKR